MRVLLITAYFPPDTGSAAHLFYELGTALAERGHEVTILTGMPGYHAQGPLVPYRRRLRLQESTNGMAVVRVRIPQVFRESLIGRALWQFSAALAFLVAGLRLPHHDAAIVYSPPLPLGLTTWGLYRLRGLPFVFNVQDLFPQSVIDLGLLRNRWIIRAFEGLERFIYARAPHITVHSAGNRAHVMVKGTAPDRVTVVSNWVDTDFIYPGERLNGFRTDHGLGNDFVVSFAGVLGYSQDLDVVLEAADLLGDQIDITWLIVGDGVEKARLETKAREMGLNCVQFLPMQPRERYPPVLHASDACLATLHARVKTPVVPSKILSIMAAGRPVIGALNPDGDALRLVEKADCGLCVPPQDPQALADAVLKLYRDPSLCETLGHNGRCYAKTHLSVDACAAKYESLLHRVVASRSETQGRESYEGLLGSIRR